ncbi:MAG: M61 family peptidase, partial [Leptospiraceae bacterium]|nr:M61 family peptidase [Leptospiraceae bacterium]
IINLHGGYGGLEHSRCSVNLFSKTKLNEAGENELLALLSHEYFHLWNVKRIRPKALGPFDYQNPNLTKELWIAEGLTSFYDNYFLLVTKVIGIRDYLHEILKDINSLTKSDGQNWMSLEESSFTTWIKYYMQNENSHNVSISYYVKGAILGLCMYLYILKETNGKKTLTDVLRHLYKVYAVEKNRGFSKEEFFEAFIQATGVDVYEEFKDFIEKPVPIPYEKYLSIVGVKLKRDNKETCLHFEVKTEDGLAIVSKTYHERLKNVDISVGDEILAINGERMNKKKIDELATTLEEGAEIHVLLSRSEKLKEVTYIAKYHYVYNYDFDFEELDKNHLAFLFFEGKIVSE